jgi:hypothetical protein
MVDSMRFLWTAGIVAVVYLWTARRLKLVIMLNDE